ncbi:primary-amine oxidase [Marchantia polymorpha subsp. ruderalis]|uniref:Amine oxidase n=1 Tax=Marchantia polymorpha TaxID=3197 RepID=A0A2R6VZB1_MARPO|nr:hypothetical protein MARPO_0257s0001 [Marchantia polymorpha]BBN18658.1 hypothetical protein Mp_8g04340 [Marchantia polymorpha subsp. ruderalis]|eukprot:PTQ26950.1 hypothetical protein MARPO_0257s0001 [Marchantia polymorpha]
MYTVMGSSSRLSYGFVLLLVCCCSLSVAHKHPLDPLSVGEHLAVRSILANSSLWCSTSTADCNVIASLEVDEPEKADVKAWAPGKKLPPRKAVVVTRLDKVVRKIIVNLDTEEIESSEVYEGYGGTALNRYEVGLLASIVSKYEPFLQSLITRGLNLQQVNYLPLSPGWYGVPDDEGKRIVTVQVFYSNGTENFYMRPIAGISVQVDVDEQRVHKFSDNWQGVPIPGSQNTDYKLEAQYPLLPPLKIISIEQPNGPSFTIDGYQIQWGDIWRFHLKMDSRAGTVISMAEVSDGDETKVWRSVMYKGFVSEMFVPYQDPTDDWYFKTYLDAGEYGLGAVSSALQPLNDCPRHAYFLDAVLSTPSGVPMIKRNAICIFERYAGDVAWRHTETFAIDGKTVTEVRPKVTLVVRMVTTVGNYDYLLDWEFQTDGPIRATAGLTGMVMPRGTKTTVVENGKGADGEELHGNLISENVVGVTHDHFLTYYLDLDVDGSENSFVESKMKTHHITPNSGVPRKSYWDVEKHVAQTEADARIKLSLVAPSEFAVINSKKTTRLGNDISYRLVPGGTAASLLDSADFPALRGAFINNQIWVTQYHKDEKYAGGQYTYQSHGDDTLAVWSSRNRKIVNEDIVLWYTLGFHHVPVQEDFPIMPTVTGGFELKPANFFEHNPILKTKPNTASEFANVFSSYLPRVERSINA